eukprot:TRINITY_DN10068_c0_g1_i1.p1 TRINITY_DN10068_c0_g1~~TRINITY_DN10068_c0_g1_i1.p1  ORF type:complete len:352 (-),score=47.59 TRINITY_DN10068_c0_g1_i1:60-1115(-)
MFGREPRPVAGRATDHKYAAMVGKPSIRVAYQRKCVLSGAAAEVDPSPQGKPTEESVSLLKQRRHLRQGASLLGTGCRSQACERQSSIRIRPELRALGHIDASTMHVTGPRPRPVFATGPSTAWVDSERSLRNAEGRRPSIAAGQTASGAVFDWYDPSSRRRMRRSKSGPPSMCSDNGTEVAGGRRRRERAQDLIYGRRIRRTSDGLVTTAPDRTQAPRRSLSASGSSGRRRTKSNSWGTIDSSGSASKGVRRQAQQRPRRARSECGSSSIASSSSTGAKVWSRLAARTARQQRRHSGGRSASLSRPAVPRPTWRSTPSDITEIAFKSSNGSGGTREQRSSKGSFQGVALT